MDQLRRFVRVATILCRTSRLQRRLPDKRQCHIGEEFMTDMAELKKRKEALNLAIVYVDPDAFIANFMGWLEITAFITAQRAGLARMPDDGITPVLSEDQLKRADVQNVGNDAIFAFCMTAALKGDKAAVDRVEAALVESLGEAFPGSSGLWHFRATIETPATLEDFVGQAGKKLLLGDIPPPPLRAKENWSTGLRFFEKARANPISSTRSCIPWPNGRASAGPRRWRRAWPFSSTSRTTFRCCARLSKIPATTSPSSRTRC
jgi:hypothetical protein